MMGAVGGPGDPQRARRAAEELAGRGVVGVALSWVDNAGMSRVKTVPVRRLADAVAAGVGMSPVFDVFLVDDSITTSAHIGGPVGDLRLYPDLDALTVLAAQPGWAWAPADRFTQEGHPHVARQRRFADNQAEEAAAGQLELSVAASAPVAAADRVVLVKETIRAVSQAHGLRASFAPVVVAGQVGNGGTSTCRPGRTGATSSPAAMAATASPAGAS